MLSYVNEWLGGDVVNELGGVRKDIQKKLGGDDNEQMERMSTSWKRETGNELFRASRPDFPTTLYSAHRTGDGARLHDLDHRQGGGRSDESAGLWDDGGRGHVAGKTPQSLGER